uniref:Uncharacterized protein n=1 Tax=Acrobeloides nanus TaxID=290746 RepID=A0A914DVU5_9BILA
MKYCILNVAITNFLLVIIFFLFQPATLFPLVGGFCFDILGVFGTEGTYLGLEITFVIILNQIVSFSCLMWYQYAIMKANERVIPETPEPSDEDDHEEDEFEIDNDDLIEAVANMDLYDPDDLDVLVNESDEGGDEPMET